MAWTRGRLEGMSTATPGCQPTVPRRASGGQSLSPLTRGLCRPWGGAERCTCSLEKGALPCAAAESVQECSRSPNRAPPSGGPTAALERASSWNCLATSGHGRGAVVRCLPASVEMQETRVQSPGGRPPGEGDDSPPRFPCLESPTVRGGWQAIVHGAAESDTSEQLSTGSNKIIKIFDVGNTASPEASQALYR